MIAEIKVGPVINTDGAVNELRGSKDSCGVVMDGHAHYQEAVYRGNVYSAANQADQAVVAALTTNITGFVLYNPIASGKNLVLWDIEAPIVVAVGSTTVGAVFLAAGVGPNVAAPTTTTALTVYNNLINSASAAVAKVYSTATVAAAPVAFQYLFSYKAAAITGIETPSKYNVDGAIIIPPGAFVSIAASNAITLRTSMTWEEIPI